MPTAASSFARIETALTEASDYEVVATLVGPDRVTPIQPSAIATLTAKMISLEPGGGTIFDNLDVKAYAGTDGAFAMPLSNTYLTAPGSSRQQKRLLILVLVQTNGKRNVQPVELWVENVPGLS